MSEEYIRGTHASRAHQDQSHHAFPMERSDEGPVAAVASGERPTLVRPLLSDLSVSGRGNAPIRQAAMLDVQRTHGNRAVQRQVGGESSALGQEPGSVGETIRKQIHLLYKRKMEIEAQQARERDAPRHALTGLEPYQPEMQQSTRSQQLMERYNAGESISDEGMRYLEGRRHAEAMEPSFWEQARKQPEPLTEAGNDSERYRKLQDEAAWGEYRTLEQPEYFSEGW